MAVQWDSKEGLSGWGVDFWKTIQGIRKNSPDVNKEIENFIEERSELFNGIEPEYLEFLRSDTIDRAQNLSGVTDELREDLADFLSTADLSGDIMEQYQTHPVKSSNQTTQFSSFTKKAGNVLKSFGTSLASMGVNMVIDTALDWAIQGLDYLINYEEKQKEAFEKAKAATEEAAKSIRDLKSEISDTSSNALELSSQFAKLVQGVNPLTNENENLSTENYERFLEINNKLAELFPSLTHNYDENGNAILGLSGDVDTVTASIQGLVEQQNNLAKINMRKHLDEYVNGTDDADGIFKTLEGSKNDADKSKNELETLENTYDSIINKHGKKYFGQNKTTYNNYLNDIKNKFGQEAYDALSNATFQEQGGHGGATTYTIDFSKLELDEVTKGKITESYNTFYQDLQTTLSLKQSELERQNHEMSNMMMIWVEDLDLYKNADDPAFKKMTEQMVNSIPWSDLDVENGNIDEAKRIIQQRVLNPLSEIYNNPDAKLKTINALNNLFTFDFSKLNYKEANEKIKSFLSVIMNAVNEGLPKEQQKSMSDMFDIFGFSNYKDISNTMENSLSSIASKGSSDYKKLEAYTDGFTQKQVESWLTVTKGANNADEAIQNYKNSLKTANESKPNSFNQAWNSIDKSGTDEQKKTKEKLLQLAEAGKLTENELKNSSLAKVFTDAGVSIEEATQKINKFAEEAKQLSALRTGITSITSAYNEKKDSKNKTVSAPTLEAMGDTLGVSEWGEKDLEVWENYKNVAGSGKKTLKELRDAQNQLASSYVNSSNFLANLNSSNADYYEGLLKEMGILNAHEIITNKVYKEQKNLGVVKKELGVDSYDLKDASVSEVAALYDVDTASEEANKAMYDLITSKIASGNVKISTANDCNNLLRMAEAAGIATNKLRALLNAQIEFDLSDRQTTDANSLQNAINSTSGNGEVSYVNSNGMKRTYSSKTSAMSALSNLRKNAKANKKKAENNVESWIKKHKDDDVKVSLSDGNKSDGGSGSKKDKPSKDKTSTQQIDWISRALDRLSSKLDLVKAKYDNLVNNKKAKNSDSLLALQNKNLHEQYELLKKTEKYQTKAQKKYTKKAKSVLISKDKKEDTSLKKAVKNGRVKGNMKSLIATYGEEKAKKIQTYQDYYDKAREVEKNLQDTRAKITQNKIDKQQLIQDNADKKIAKYQAERENALLKYKNNTIKSQIDEIERSYAAQIKIAQIEEDSVTEAKLRAEKQKAINDLYQEEIDNIKANTDAKIKLLETGSVNNNGTRKSYGQQYYKNQVDLIESRGLAVDASWYQEQNRIERNKIAEKESERAKLIRELSNYEEESEQWYNLQSDIADCENSIVESKKAINENSSAIRNLRNTIETKANERLDGLSSELEFISNLKYGETTDSDKGTFTDTGNLSMYTTAIQIATAQAAKQYNKDNLNTLNQLYEDYKKGYGNSQTWKDAGFDGYFNDDGSLNLDNVEEDLKNYRQLVQDNISAEIQGEQTIIDLMKQKYEAQKSYLQDIIDAKKEALNIEKDLYDYERNIADKTKSVANLQKQINALQGDDSEEGRARLAKLQVSLDDAQKDLQDTEYDRYISDQQNMLDNLMTEYEDLITELTKDTQSILIDGFNYIKQNKGGLGSLLKQVAEERNYPTSTDLLTISNALSSDDYAIHATIKESDEAPISTAIMGMASQTEELNKKLSEKLVGEQSPSNSNNNVGAQKPASKVKDTITEELSGIAALDKTGSDANKRYGVNQFIRKNGTKPKKKKKDWKDYSDVNYKIVKEFGVILSTDNLKKLATQVGVKYDNATKSGNLYKKLKSMNVQGFSRGGIGRLLKRKGEDGFAMVRDGEGFVRPEDVPPIKDFVRIAPKLNDLMQPMLHLPKSPKFTPNVAANTTTVSDVQFSFNLPNVKDSKTLLSEIQTDPKIQKAILEVGLGQANGNGKLSVNRIR